MNQVISRHTMSKQLVNLSCYALLAQIVLVIEMQIHRSSIDILCRGQEHIPIEVAIFAFFYPIYSKGLGVLENVSGYLLLKRG